MSTRINSSTARKMIKDKKQRSQRNRVLTVLGALLVIALFVGGIMFLVQKSQPLIVSKNFGPDDIVYGQPLVAVHEMVVFNPETIPFLPEDGPQPKIAFSESEYNFGVIGLNDVVSREFLIANQGKAPLTISRAYTTCGCTTVEITASVIPPGKAAIAKLTFDAGYHDSGGKTVQRGVIIESNDPQFPKSEIWTQASVRMSP